MEGRNEADAKVHKAEEFPGVSPRVHFPRNCATFLRNKAGKVIRRPRQKPLSFFPEQINRSHVRRIRDGKKKERSARYEKRIFWLKGLLFIRAVIQDIVSSPWRNSPFLRTFVRLSACTFNAHVATFAT